MTIDFNPKKCDLRLNCIQNWIKLQKLKFTRTRIYKKFSRCCIRNQSIRISKKNLTTPHFSFPISLVRYIGSWHYWIANYIPYATMSNKSCRTLIIRFCLQYFAHFSGSSWCSEISGIFAKTAKMCNFVLICASFLLCKRFSHAYKISLTFDFFVGLCANALFIHSILVIIAVGAFS